MRTYIRLYTGVPIGQPRDVRGFRLNAGGNVPIHGFIFSHGGDD
jgi:hypothetical protein